MTIIYKDGDRVVFNQAYEHVPKDAEGTVIHTVAPGSFHEAEQLVYVRLDKHAEGVSVFAHRLNLLKNAKAQGLAKPARHAGSAWLVKVLVAFKEFCEAEYVLGRGDTTIDEFRLRGFFGAEPKNPNAWGSVPNAALRAGYIKSTDRIAISRRPAAQRRISRVWEIDPAAL